MTAPIGVGLAGSRWRLALASLVGAAVVTGDLVIIHAQFGYGYGALLAALLPAPMGARGDAPAKKIPTAVNLGQELKGLRLNRGGRRLENPTLSEPASSDPGEADANLAA